MFRLSLILLLLLATASPNQQPATQTTWQLVWSDEFDYSGLPDPSKWGYDVGGHGWGNKEQQNYTEKRKENSRVEKGVLIIEARRDGDDKNRYTSARLVSKGKGDWIYGRFEVKAKLPSGRGTWPAIWMLPTQRSYGVGYWPDNGEIDIMEHVGYDPDVIHGSAHTKAYHHSIGTQKLKKRRLSRPEAGSTSIPSSGLPRKYGGTSTTVTTSLSPMNGSQIPPPTTKNGLLTSLFTCF
jgi:beta-glucanase (GH16 family)